MTGRIEGLAVEGDQRTRPAKILGDQRQHRPLGGKVGHQVLLGDKRPILLEPPAADQKCMRPRATTQAGGLQIEEHERQGRQAS